MGLLRAPSKIRGGYPGGRKQYARGYQGTNPPPFVQPHDPDDRRSLIPPTEHARGLKRPVQVTEATIAEPPVAAAHAWLEVPQNGAQALTNGDTNGAGMTAETEAGTGHQNR